LKKKSTVKTRFSQTDEQLTGIRERAKKRKLESKKKHLEKRYGKIPEFNSVAKARENLDATIVGLEHLQKQLSNTQKKILNVIISDFRNEKTFDEEGDKEVFRRLKAACWRAGMTKDKKSEAEFFRTIADPQFHQVVKTVGTGLIGMYIVPLMSKQIELAMQGNQTALDRLLEIVGLKQSKYDFYMNRVALKKTEVNVEGDINFDKKSDRELEEIIASFEEADECESETVACGD